MLWVSGCVTIPNTRECTAKGRLLDGAMCAETITGRQIEMTFEEYLAFLEPTPERPGAPARGGAICRSAEDFTRQKNALEKACRLLGNRCTYEMRMVIQNKIP